MWVYDLETLRFLEVNDAAVSQYGYTRDEFLAMHITDIRPAEDVARLLENVEKERLAFDRAGVWQHLRKDGRIIDVEVTSHLLSFVGRPAALVLMQDVTERKQAEESLQAEARRLTTVVATQQEIAGELDIEAIAQLVVDRMQDLTGAEGAGIGLIEGENIVYRAVAGTLPRGLTMRCDAGLTGICLRTGETVLSADIQADARTNQHMATALGARAAVVVPLRDGDRYVGVLAVSSPRTGLFDQQDLEMLQLLAGQVSAAMSRAAAFEAQQRLLGERAERNRVLEQQVAQRTAQLEASNQELEAFAYSVSHDLRAPLRSMDGFSQVLLQRYADQLDDRGSRYLTHIRDAAQEMGQLIDALLMLSRVSRSEMQHEQVDLAALAHAIVADLGARSPTRSIAWVIAHDLVTTGDERLLRAALDNLLGNAWKFTRGREDARIELGMTSENGHPVYFVRDNGAGFDMAYADKLFAPFQRLHGTSEFEGTGIGLATVQRIVHRHGGRIWAEGAVGEGATFSFTFQRACEEAA
jgi:PAS domain S-box-containing protein